MKSGKIEGNGNVPAPKKSSRGQECSVMKCLRTLWFLQPRVITLKIIHTWKEKDVIKSLPYSDQQCCEVGSVPKHPHIFLSSSSNDFLLTSLLRLCVLFPTVSVSVSSVSHHLLYSSVSFGLDLKAKPFNLLHLFQNN